MNPLRFFIITLLLLIQYCLGAVEATSLPLPEISQLSSIDQINEDNELKLIDHLIIVTQQNLEDQKELQQLTQQFKTTQLAFTQDTENKQLAYTMISEANQLLKFIKEKHLSHLFSKDFIKELDFFSQFAKKNEIASP